MSDPLTITGRRRVLFVSYLFPPVGGVGVHRVAKFVKYLPEFGWDSSVLTVSNPSVPLVDGSLEGDIPPGTLIRRAKTREPGYAVKQAVSGGGASGSRRALPGVRMVKDLLRSAGNLVLQPDPQILWHPAAYREAMQLLNDVQHDAIVATGPPFSSFLLGAKLSRETGLPLVLDYRDEWDLSNSYWENKRQGRFSQWIQERQQRRAMQQADLLLATTPSSAEAIAERAHQLGCTPRSAYVYNGFDPDDFASTGTGAKQDFGNGTARFRLSFIGTLWNLNSIESLVAGIEHLAQRSPHLLEHLELLVAGRRTEDQEQRLDRLEALPCAVTRLPFVSHDEAVALMQSSDALLMLNADLPHTGRIINAKVFEYMAARRPMFVVAPRGDVWDIVRDLPGSALCVPGDSAAIAEQLALKIEQHRCRISHDEEAWDIDRFQRRELAGELALELETTLSLCGEKTPADADAAADLVC